MDGNGILTPVYSALAYKQYFCVRCGREVTISKKKFGIKSYAHSRGQSCLTDKNPFSDWHDKWKEKFPAEFREIPASNSSGDSRRADVLMGGYVLEFQSSRMASKEFDARNKFWTGLGYKIIWIFNLFDVKEVDKAYRRNLYKDSAWSAGDASGFRWRWLSHYKTFENFFPQRDKNVILLFQTHDLYSKSPDGHSKIFHRVVWSAERFGKSDFWKFDTISQPSTMNDLLYYIENNKF